MNESLLKKLQKMIEFQKSSIAVDTLSDNVNNFAISPNRLKTFFVSWSIGGNGTLSCSGLLKQMKLDWDMDYKTYDR